MSSLITSLHVLILTPIHALTSCNTVPPSSCCMLNTQLPSATVHNSEWTHFVPIMKTFFAKSITQTPKQWLPWQEQHNSTHIIENTQPSNNGCHRNYEHVPHREKRLLWKPWCDLFKHSLTWRVLRQMKWSVKWASYFFVTCKRIYNINFLSIVSLPFFLRNMLPLSSL